MPKRKGSSKVGPAIRLGAAHFIRAAFLSLPPLSYAARAPEQ
jgi:hypothetical protein